MQNPLRIDVITIFPSMLQGFIGQSICRRAEAMGAASYRVVNLRDYASDRHKTVDDRPYGGGPGMIMKPEPFFKAVEDIRTPGSRVILMSPKGRRFDQAAASDLARASHLIFLCGHYEGVDQRICNALATDEISIGDYVLTNGVLAAAVVIDAVVRLLPGVLCAGAAEDESFQRGLLEHPQYTRPATFRDMKVPEVLRSGDHSRIARWREEEAERGTDEQRPDLRKTTSK